MKKQYINIILFLVMVSYVAAASDPINQTLTEFSNLTKADNALELTQEINTWVSGYFGIFILIIIFAATFGLTMFYTQQVSKSLVLALFIETVAAALLRLIALVPDVALYYSFPLFILSIGLVILSK